ncbi:MAG: hypothetical protein A2Z25_18465 [Planctomycetes bacterium RBG_16_55_9]|nr:MAG: hypothetical protein A2Z25_18465 [Planctomycetes bacterium RBG_16_55_9]
MRMKTITYVQFEEKPREWGIDNFSLGNINLVVGKNATGKSKILNVIGGLANLISGDVELKFRSGKYNVVFDNDGKEITYILEYEESRVLKEKLIINSKPVLDRHDGGRGTIFAEEENKEINFQAPENQLACVNRRDDVQHPFFEALYKWGKQMRHYHFGSPLGKDCFAIINNDEKGSDLNPKDTNQVVVMFWKGRKEFSDRFVDAIKVDMKSIGYNLDKIDVGRPMSLAFKPGPIQIPNGMLVQESDLDEETDQNDMSQGMFRAMSLLIQLNYSQMGSIPSCILIDDIGEGLDYERASALIKLLVEKAKNSKVQLIMSTNDRFVMNNVPLEYWSVVRRLPKRTKIYNYKNARKTFEEFELTGLNNFDFFSSRFYVEGKDQK